MTTPDGRSLRLGAWGGPSSVLVDGHLRVVWTESSADGSDALLVHDGALLVWPTVQACAAWVHARSGRAEDARPEVAEPVDVDATRRWVAQVGAPPPAAALLDVWNLAADVATTLALPLGDRGRMSDRLHAMLTATVLPQYFPRAPARVTWTPYELDRLRERALRHARLVARALDAGGAPAGS